MFSRARAGPVTFQFAGAMRRITMRRRKRFSIKLAADLFMITSRCYEADLKRVEPDLVDVSPELALA